jgi:hypothetical protein
LLREAHRANQDGDLVRAIRGSELAFDGTVEQLFETSDVTEGEIIVGTILYHANFLDFLEEQGMPESDRNLLEHGLRELAQRTVRAERLAGLLASGVSYEDYRRFVTTLGEEPAEWGDSDARWIHMFVVNSVITWQTNGLVVYIAPYMRDSVESYMQDNGGGTGSMDQAADSSAS